MEEKEIEKNTGENAININNEFLNEHNTFEEGILIGNEEPNIIGNLNINQKIDELSKINKDKEEKEKMESQMQVYQPKVSFLRSIYKKVPGFLNFGFNCKNKDN